MVFLSNYLVFKIVLAALGRVDYPVAGDLELKYDTANKIYLSGGSLDYVDDATLYTTIGGETTSYELNLGIILNKTTTTAYEVALPANSVHATFGINQDATRYVHQYPVSSGYLNGKFQVYSGTPSGGYTTYGTPITPFNGNEKISCSMSADGKYILIGNWGNGNNGYKMYKDNGSSYAYHSAYPFIGSSTPNTGYQPAFVPSNNNFVITGTNNNTTWYFKLYVYDSSTETWTGKATVQPSGSSTADSQRGVTGKGFSYDGSYFFQSCNGTTTRGEVWSVDWNANTMTKLWHTTEGNNGDGAGGAISPDNRYVVLCNHIGNPYRVYENTSGDWSTVVNVTSDFDLTGSGTSTVFGSYGIGFSGYSSENTTPLYIGQAAGLYGDGKFRLENWTKKSPYQIYITDAGKYSVDATIAGLNYKTNEVEVTGSITPAKSWKATEDQIVYASDGVASDHFGWTISISGDYAIVGAPYEDTGGANGGAVYIYKRDSTTGVWGSEQKILASDKQASDQFGISVSMDGDYAIVGARYEDTGGLQAGAVYIFKKSGTSWSQQQIIYASDAQAGDNFGHSVGISGDYAIVGAPYEDSGADNGGSAYIYKRNTSTDVWGSEQHITASNAGNNDYFGISVSISGDYAIVGANGENSASGGVYIYTRNTSTGSWGSEQLIRASDAQGVDEFGYFVNISGDYAIVGSRNEDTGGTDAGAAYIYVRSGTTWSEQQKIQSSDIQAGDQFGESVSINSNYAIVGAWRKNSSIGAVYIFERSGTTWTEVKKITASDAQADDNFGYSVAIDGTNVFVGARDEDTKGSDAGAVYIFDKSTIAELKFDNYNKLSLTNTPTNTSSKLFFGSNVYDIGTLTSDLTIETPGLYRGLVFDTSSNVAYFNKTTVGAIGTTMASYEKQDQVLDAGTNAGYSNGDASQGGYGNSIDMSADGTRMVVGNAHYTDSNGRVWLYHLENGLWVLKQTWDGGTRLGSQVAMNEAGTRAFALYTGGGVKIWDYSSGAWDTSASGTYSISPGTINGEVPAVDCNKAGDVVIIGSGNSSNNTWIYRLSGGSWSSEKNFSRMGSGVAMNGDGTRCFMGDRSSHKVWESNYSGGSWGTETEIISESSFSGYWPASLSTDSVGETVCIKSGNSGNGAIYERAGNGSWSASVSGILSKTEVYGADKVALSYDGTMALFGHMRDSGALSTGGHALLYTKSGSTWTLTQTLLNPSSSQDSNDFFGGGTGLAKTVKDRFVVAAMGDDNAGTNYGAIYTYTNAIPDFISFDTYNKLSLSGITNPTSKIHALPTGAESTTTYDIGTATNIYIESAGTYTAEMKGSDGFALDSTVVSGTISFPSRTSYRYLALAFPRNNYENSIRTMTIEFDDGTKFDNANPPASSAFTENYAGNNATTDIFNSSTNTNYNGNSLGWTAGTWYCPFHIDCGSGFTKKVKRVTIINGQSDYQYSLIAPRLYGASSVPSTPGLAANWNYVCHVESIQNGWTLETSSYDMEPAAYRYIGLVGYRTKFTMHIYEFSIELVDGTVYDGSNIPTVSSNMTVAGGSVAETIDGVWTTSGRWNSASTYTSASQQYVYLKVDLGSAKKVKHVRVWSNYTGSYENGPNSMNYYGSSTNTSSVSAEGSSDWNRLGPIETLKSNDTTEQTINSSLYDSKLEFDGYNKLSLNKFDPTSSTLKYFSNTYDLGTISNVYIANAGTYSAEIKGATNFALSSNVTSGTITPYKVWKENEDQILYASDAAASDHFGTSVAIRGDYAISSSYNDDGEKGSAYIFYKSGGTWTQQTKLVASDGAGSDRFGWSVAIDGEYAIIGSVRDDDPTDSGSAYIFERSGTSWTQQSKLTASDAQADDQFGGSVSLSGDYAIVGARFEDTGGSNAGAAYIYKRDASTGVWGSEQKIQASDKQAVDFFGESVSLSGDYAIVGAVNDDVGSSDTNHGAAYIYTRNASTGVWGSEQKIQASDIQAADYYGRSVSISGAGYAIVGGTR